MITNKHVTKIVLVLISLAMVVCIAAKIFSNELTEALGGTGVSVEYEEKLFNTDDIISLEIEMDEKKWNEMLADAASETYYKCNVIVNGTKFYNVGIRPKGNTSLTAIANDPDSERYSFKLEFDYYVDGQTCWGLDKLALNNNYADTTNMKEAIVYDMYQYLDADASLYNYAKIKVNNNDWGIYLAVEAVEDSFLLRNYGVNNGDLYKPDNMNMDQANMEGQPEMPTTESGEMPDMQNSDKNKLADAGNDDGMFGGLSMENNGADLNYSDNDLDSYSAIWDGAVTKSGDAAHRRVVTALKNINEGTELETYLDVDNVLKYMAVHSFSVNDDSLSGSMAHNYYLYEKNGQLNIIPWDYNLSFGGMTMAGPNITSTKEEITNDTSTDSSSNTNASDVINDPIDSPFSMTDFFNALLENEEYATRYHEYYRQLVESYVEGGEFDKTYTRIRNQIDEEVKIDPNSLYTYDEYVAGADMLYDTIMLRAESVEGQLNGKIPSTEADQKADNSMLIDASSIDVDVMGAFAMEGMMEADGNSSREKGKNIRTENTDNSNEDSAETKLNSEKAVPNFSDGTLGNSESNNSKKTENILIYAGSFVFLWLLFIFIKHYRRKPQITIKFNSSL